MKFPKRSAHGFSLVEVILAISISVVILVVAIYFYHQITNLRRQLIEETEKVTTIRLLLQRMSSDLRSVDPTLPNSFIGASNSLTFTLTETRLQGPWTGPGPWANGTHQVTYRLNQALDGTNLVSLGLVREEAAAPGAPALPPPVIEGEETNDLTLETNIAFGFEIEEPTNELASVTNLLQQPLTELVRGLEFQYWTGLAWTNSWNEPTPPRGVAVLLTTEYPDPSTGLYEPDVQFRKSIYIPGQQPALPLDADTTATNELAEDLPL